MEVTTGSDPVDTGALVNPGRAFRILIVDNVIGNMGDAAIMLAMKSSLEAAFGPNAEVRNCFCGLTADPQVYATLYPELHFTRTLWNAAHDFMIPQKSILKRLVRKTAPARWLAYAKMRRLGIPSPLLWPDERSLFCEYEEADMIVVSGGNVLNTSWTEARLRRPRIAQYEIASILNKPLVFYSMSFGPYTPDDPLPAMVRPHIEKAIAVLCRDRESVGIVSERIGYSGPNVHQTIDDALSIEPRPPSRPMAPPKTQPLRIGICVHQWAWVGSENPEEKQRAFEERMSKVCSTLLARGDVEMAFLTTHQRVENAGHTDEDVMERIAANVEPSFRDRIHIISGFVHPREFAHFMGECDVVLTSRLHGGILSLVGGAPIVALEYEPKTRGLMRQLDIEDWVLSMGESTAGEIVAKVEEILKDLPKARRRQSEAMAVGKRLAMRSREIVLAAYKLWQVSGSVNSDK